MDLLHSKDKNKVELGIYSNKKSQNKAQLGIHCIKKFEMRYGCRQTRLRASFWYKAIRGSAYLHNLTKYEINGTSISPVYQLFSEVEQRLILKKQQFFIIFLNWKK